MFHKQKAGRALSDNASRHSEEEEDVVQITVDGTVYRINFPMFKTEDLSLWKRNKEPFCHGKYSFNFITALCLTPLSPAAGIRIIPDTV